MIQAFDVSETREYSLQSDKGEPKTVFIVGWLDSALQAFVNDRTVGFRANGRGPDTQADVNVNTNMRLREIVKFGVRGWRNFQDKNSQDVPVDFVSVSLGRSGNRTGLSARCRDVLKPYIPELAKQIESGSWLTADEAGNFDLPSQGT
jgi:hypothetical protein